MRTFRVWLNKQVHGAKTKEVTIELPDDATDEEAEEACQGALSELIGNELDTGWEEL